MQVTEELKFENNVNSDSIQTLYSVTRAKERLRIM